MKKRGLAQAEAATDSDKLVHYSLLAGDRARAAYDWEEALGHFQRALAAKEGSTVDAAMAALLPLYQVSEAVGSLSRAFDYYAQAGEVEQAVAIAEHPLPTMAGHDTGVGQLLGRALELAPPDSVQAGRLLYRYGNDLALRQGNYQRGQEALGRALDIARGQGDLGLEMRTLVSTAEVEFYHTRWSAWRPASGPLNWRLAWRIPVSRCWRNSFPQSIPGRG